MQAFPLVTEPEYRGSSFEKTESGGLKDVDPNQRDEHMRLFRERYLRLLEALKQSNTDQDA